MIQNSNASPLREIFIVLSYRWLTVPRSNHVRQTAGRACKKQGQLSHADVCFFTPCFTFRIWTVASLFFGCWLNKADCFKSSSRESEMKYTCFILRLILVYISMVVCRTEQLWRHSYSIKSTNNLQQHVVSINHASLVFINVEKTTGQPDSCIV